jgi:hypothetical protein
MDEEGKKRRKEAMQNMLNELRKEKEDMIEKREDLKKQYKAMDDDNPMKNYTLLKVRKIEEDLQTEFYKLVHEKDDIQSPSVSKAKPAP